MKHGRMIGVYNEDDLVIPIFLASRFSRSQVSLKCPKCRKVNLHGYGDGIRVSHCPCWPNGYYVETEHLQETP